MERNEMKNILNKFRNKETKPYDYLNEIYHSELCTYQKVLKKHKLVTTKLNEKLRSVNDR